MNNLTDEYLAGLAERMRGPLSDEARRQAAMCLVDYLGCAYIGHSMIAGRVAGFLETAGADAGKAVVIGAGRSTAMQTAALLNGMQAHAAELDDGHRFGMVHVGAPVISALLAVAAAHPMSGEQFVRGVVCGYEALVRLASAIQPGHKLKGFHATGTCGTIGAAMGIACALGFAGSELKAVLSAAATDAAGLLEMMSGPSTLKPYNVGRAAAGAVNAAFAGRAGFSGPDDALGGKRGFLAASASEVDVRLLAEGVGGRFAIETIYRKPYAACRHCHAAIEAAVKALCAAGERADDITSVEVATYGLAVGGHDHTRIEGPSSAKMSIPYSVAAALVYGDADYQRFEPACINDERVRALTAKVSVAESPELSSLVPEKRAAQVTVRTGCAVCTERVDYPKGEPENPMSVDEVNAKFSSLLSASGQDEAYAHELLECAWQAGERLPGLLEMLR